MKNHFIYPYLGNKRTEIELFYNLLDFNGINTIIEPYCGSSSISYYIALKNPGKYKYILNDNDENLFKLYNIMKDEEAINKLNEELNIIINKFNSYGDDDINRKKYYFEIKKINNFYSYIFIRKYYSIKPGLYPSIDRIKQIKPFNIRDFDIYNFIKNEDITFLNENGLDIIKKYKDNEENMILLDPPYLVSFNDFYNNSDVHIYEWLYFNNINNFKCYLILEDMWIIKLLFQRNKILLSYNKTYQVHKKNTTHLLITKI